MLFFRFKNLKEKAEKEKMKFIRKEARYFKKVALKELKRCIKNGKTETSIKIMARTKTDDYNNDIARYLRSEFIKDDRYKEIDFIIDSPFSIFLRMRIKE